MDTPHSISPKCLQVYCCLSCYMGVWSVSLGRGKGIHGVHVLPSDILFNNNLIQIDAYPTQRLLLLGQQVLLRAKTRLATLIDQNRHVQLVVTQCLNPVLSSALSTQYTPLEGVFTPLDDRHSLQTSLVLGTRLPLHLQLWSTTPSLASQIKHWSCSSGSFSGSFKAQLKSTLFLAAYSTSKQQGPEPSSASGSQIICYLSAQQ